ncbi:MAG: DUF2975 domain-containing protein [Marinicellaceae bacterium]
MNTLLILSLAILVYASFLFWLFKRFKFKQIWQGPTSHNTEAHKSPLTLFVKRALDFFIILFLCISLAIPVIAVVMAISQTDVPTWGIDIGIFSGFKLNLAEMSGIEAMGVRNQEFSGKGLVSIDTSNLYAWYLFIVISQVSALVALYVTNQLRNMVLSLLSNTPFNNDNPQRIKKIGIVIIVWNVLNPLVQYFGWGSVVNGIAFNNTGIQLHPAFEVNVIAVLIGLMLLLLSGLLNEAKILKQEQELTI